MRSRRSQPKRLHHLGRLHPLALGLALSGSLIACEEPEAKKETPTPAPARSVAVTQKAGVSEKDLDGFCDIRAKGKLQLPKTSGPSEPSGKRWVNLWATWCKSCVEEMPMIESWKKDHGFQVFYVSTDEEPEQLQAFQKKHPELPTTATMDEPDALQDWMKGLGLDDGAGLPLHVFVSDDNSVLCARAAAVSEHHLPLIKSLLK